MTLLFKLHKVWIGLHGLPLKHIALLVSGKVWQQKAVRYHLKWRKFSCSMCFPVKFPCSEGGLYILFPCYCSSFQTFYVA
jgi:hypothetical protein